MRGGGRSTIHQGMRAMFVERLRAPLLKLPPGSSLRRSVLRRIVGAAWPTYAVANKAGSKEIFLTFDDGPHPLYTKQLLAVLAQNGHKATFFMTGRQAAQHRSAVTEVLDAGHRIGSHGSAHLDWEKASKRNRFKDYWRGHKELEKIVGSRVKLFRPPHGCVDLVSLAAAFVLRARFSMWSSDSLDWQLQASTASMVANVKKTLEPGSIVLFHDHIVHNHEAQDRTQTVAAVERLLQHVEELGMKSAVVPLRGRNG